MKPERSDSGGSVRDKTVLVVGKNSYVGQFLSEHFRAQGFSVTAIGSADCDFLNPDAVERLFQSFADKPLIVLFLAVVNKSADNSYTAFVDNNQMIWNLASGARGANIESLVYFSSVDVYGRSPKLPIDESSPLDPDTWYGLSKSTGEWIARHQFEPRCPTCILRLPGIFGAARNDPSVIGRLIRSIREQGKISLHGDGRVLRDYVFAPDLCRVVERLVLRRAHGVFNVVTGRSVSLLEIASAIRTALEVDFEVVHLPAEARSFDMSFETSRLSAALGDFQFSPLVSAIRHYR